METKTINEFSKDFIKKATNKIHIVSHFDTDGITSAAILSKTLERIEKQFSVKIIKQLTEDEINKFPKEKIIFLLDLGSNQIKRLSILSNEIFILDHHEIEVQEIPKNITIFNPHLTKENENLCSSELTYLFSKSISTENKDLANLAVLGMIGDVMDKEITKTRNEIIKDGEVKIKKSLLLYPATRPIDKVLEFNSMPFIPGITGNANKINEFLKEIGFEKINRNYKALMDLTESEMKKLISAVMQRFDSNKESELIGNIFLIKFFNKIEDAREISAIINACGKMEKPEIALLLCLGNSEARKKAESLYLKYRQNLITGLKIIENEKKIIGKEFVIINCKDKIKDSLIGTLTSIISFSSIYPEGTIIITMAESGNKIKVSARYSGKFAKAQRNLKEIMDFVTSIIGGDSGGHEKAAGCTIEKSNEEKFIELIKKKLEFEIVKL